MKGRIAQVIYVLGALGALGILGFTLMVLGVVALNPREYEEGMSIGVVLAVGMAVAAYGAGWAVRYIMTGETGSVLDRFRKA